MIALDYTVIETATYVAPFGLGLWDTVTGRLVSNGFNVRVFALAGTNARGPVNAYPNQSNIFVANELRGLRSFQAGSGDDNFWRNLPPALPFLVDVRDPTDRFTSFVIHVNIPRARGLVLPQCIDSLWPIGTLPLPPSSPPTEPAFVPVFSAPARTVSAGMTAVRALLVDAGTSVPAEYAVLEIREAGRLIARGISDARGEVSAVFAYPEPPLLPAPSPPGSGPAQQPLTEQEWQLDIAVRYKRNLQRFKPDTRSAPLADLCDVLSQPFATISVGSPPATITSATLRYGAELVLSGVTSSEIFVNPA